jgi:hypothetical protein
VLASRGQRKGSLLENPGSVLDDVPPDCEAFGMSAMRGRAAGLAWQRAGNAGPLKRPIQPKLGAGLVGDDAVCESALHTVMCGEVAQDRDGRTLSA